MTVPVLGNPREVMQVADFRDFQALFIPKFGKWVGLSRGRGLRFGKGPVRLVDGVWRCTEDREAQEGREDLVLSPDILSLETIK